MSTRLRTLAGVVALAAIVAAWVAAGGHAADDPLTPRPPDDPDAVRDVFLLLDRGPVHLRLKITIAGKSPQAVRRGYLARLFKSLDTDRDGKLTRAEYEKSPLDESRRGPTARPLPAREAAEIVPASRLADALERVAGETLAFRQDNTARKTDDQVFAALDINRDGGLTEAEIRQAQPLLLSRDTDDDDCITIDEFTPPDVAMMVVPVGIGVPERPLASASTLLVDGAGLLFGPRLVRRYDLDRDGKLSQREIGLSDERFRMLDTDGDGKLTTEELKEFRKQSPDMDAMVELEPPAGQSPRVEVGTGSKARATRPDTAVFGLADTDLALAVRAFDPIESARTDAQQQFNRLDADQNGYLDRDELKENIRFQRGLFEAIDSDSDNKLFWPEMEAYVKSRAEAKATQCLIMLHDLGHGFFEALDLNHDGRLGLREIRAAAATLERVRKPGQTTLRATDPPRRLHLEVIRAPFQLFGTGMAGESTLPRKVAQARTGVGPVWFQRMDRNLDGDLTWKEFLGPRHVFEELDANDDGLIDPFEAEKAR